MSTKKTAEAIVEIDVIDAPANDTPAKTAAGRTRKTAAKKPAAKTAKTTTKKKGAAEKAAEDTVKELASTAKKTVKKAPAKKTAAKKTTTKKAAKADVMGSQQSQAQIDAAMAVDNKEALDGKKVYEGIEALAPETPYEAVTDPAMAARIELAKKSAAENNAQKNLSARSVKDAKAAAKGYKKPARKKAAKKNAAGQTKAVADAALKNIAKEAQDGARVYRGIEAIKGTPYEEVVKAHEDKCAKAARSALAAKAAAKFTLSAPQTKAEEAARIQMIGNEAEKGAAVYRGIEDLAADSPYENVTDPAMAARMELAKKSAAENNAQKNLSARSAADAAKAAKGYKKPARKKAAKKNAVGQTKAAEDKQLSSIAKEAKDGAKVYRGIEEVQGTPYEEVVKAHQAKAAMNARTALAAKQRVAKGQKPENPMELNEDKQAFYSSLDDGTLMEMAQALGLDMDLETLKGELQATADLNKTIEEYLDQAKAGRKYSFAKDGFDLSVIPFLCQRVYDSLPNKASDHIEFANKIAKDVDRMLINDSLNDTAIYNDLFDDMRQVLMIGQKNGFNTLEEVETIIPADLQKLADRFMTVAYTILPGWQYNDVKYYEGFIYSVLAQFDDLASQQNRAMMDVADLYILHGDYNQGNADYGYVLRENQLKDQIYFRFANVYRPFDLQRAKSIAQDALRYVDGRYEYYPRIIEILNS